MLNTLNIYVHLKLPNYSYRGEKATAESVVDAIADTELGWFTFHGQRKYSVCFSWKKISRTKCVPVLERWGTISAPSQRIWTICLRQVTVLFSKNLATPEKGIKLEMYKHRKGA